MGTLEPCSRAFLSCFLSSLTGLVYVVWEYMYDIQLMSCAIISHGECSLQSLKNHFAGTLEVTEAALVRDILYVFQGIDGKNIKMSSTENCYKVEGKVCNSILPAGRKLT